MIVNCRDNAAPTRSSNKKKPGSVGLEDQYNLFLKRKLKESDYYYTYYGKLYINNKRKREVIEEEVAYLKHKVSVLIDNSHSVTGIRPASASAYARFSKRIEEYNKVLRVLPLENTVYIDYNTFKTILKQHNESMQDYLLKGYRFKLSYRLGYLEMRKVFRNFDRKRIDFGATRKKKARLLKEGVKQEELRCSVSPEGTVEYIVYFKEDYYPVLSFISARVIPNSSVYKFIPSGGQVGKGFKNKIQNTIKEKPYLMSLFPAFGKKIN